MTMKSNTTIEHGKRRRFSCGLAFLASALVLAGPGQAQAQAQAQQTLAIQPLTRIGPDGSGYLADPQPIHLAPSAAPGAQMLSGTTEAVVGCHYPLKSGSCAWTPIHMGLGALADRITVTGPGTEECPEGEVCFTNFQNIDLFQDDQGHWQAAVTIGVRTREHPQHWTFIAHAHPNDATGSDMAPRSWQADTILSGSLSDPAQGNYDAKYFEDSGRLYLLFVDMIDPKPLRNAIFLQRMQSFTQPAHEPRVMLLRPGSRDGSLVSEDFAAQPAKLVEAPYISKISGKYALVYSTGSFLTSGYKAGIAWSDTLVPKAGRTYRKVLQVDRGGIWGKPGAHEVHYLVQSAEPGWPNYTGAQVLGPGVASAVEGPGGAWWLYFNGYAPNDMSTGSQVEPSHRRPYALRLEARIPPHATVSSASDDELASWLAPKSR